MQGGPKSAGNAPVGLAYFALQAAGIYKNIGKLNFLLVFIQLNIYLLVFNTWSKRQNIKRKFTVFYSFLIPQFFID